MNSIITTIHNYIGSRPYSLVESTLTLVAPSYEDEEFNYLNEASKVMLRFLKDLYTEAGIDLEILQAYEETDIIPQGEMLHKYDRIKEMCIGFFEWQRFVSSQAQLLEIKDRWTETKIFDITPRPLRSECLSCISDLITFIGDLYDDLKSLPQLPRHEWPIPLDN